MKKVEKTEEEWRSILSDEEYRVTRDKGTERPFSGKYTLCKDPGTYKCTCCGAELFDAKDKFDSGTGWPSFTAPAVDDNVETEEDTSLFMVRTEVMCSKCGAHLGHVFNDGPAPTGKRYCINSVSLKHEKD